MKTLRLTRLAWLAILALGNPIFAADAPAPAAKGTGARAVAPAVRCHDAAAKDQDDVCLWIHPTDPSKSTVIASDKEAGRIIVYDLKGETIQTIAIDRPANIDSRTGFPLGGRKVDIVALNQREPHFKILVYRVDPETRRLERIDNDRIATGENYGGTLYHSAKTGKFYFITTAKEGPFEQWELFDDGAGHVAGRKVRSWKVGYSEGAVADDAGGKVYTAEEAKGVWEVGAEPDDPTPGRLVVKVGEHGLRGDVEGLAIHWKTPGGPCLLASGQGNSTFKVYRLGGDFRFVGTFTIKGAVDTDGIDVTGADLGPPFARGLFACHTDTDGRPVLLTPWEKIAEALGPALAAPSEEKAPGPANAPAPANTAAPADKPATPPFEPTENFVAQDVEGWKVLVHKRLLNEQKDLGAETLKVLRMHLYDVTRQVPPKALAELRKVTIWVEADNPKVVCMCYHPSREWLAGHDFNPEKAKCVELGNPKNFLDWTHHQKAMVLHELAHAYHHQVLGYDQPDIKAAFKKAQDAKSYESVLYYDGSKKRAYGMNNDQEYFAELSEAYFGTNDIYPFVRAEVKEHDPGMFEVLKKVWEK